IHSSPTRRSSDLSFTTEAPFDASLMVSIRYRLGREMMESFNQLVLQQAGIIPAPQSDGPAAGEEQSGKDDNDNAVSMGKEPDKTRQAESDSGGATCGTLMMDATVAEQQIEYPTYLKLLNEGRMQLERMIEQVCNQGGLRQPGMYKKIARKKYLTLAKKKRKTKRQIRRGLREQLQ